MKKKGFTLIELMIVLAVIAILAVVLIPKAGQAKSNAKNAGVTTNVNAVRGYLETKTGANFIDGTDAATGLTNLKSAIEKAFPTGAAAEDALVNPIDETQIGYTAASGGAITIDSTAPAALNTSDLEGDVVIVYDYTNKAYTIFGVDNAGNKVSETKVKK